MSKPRPRFALESIVYLRVAPEEGGMVTGIVERPGNVHVYLVTWSDGDEKCHWEAELTNERSFSAAGSGGADEA